MLHGHKLEERDRNGQRNLFQQKLMEKYMWTLSYTRPIFYIDVGANKGLYTGIALENPSTFHCLSIEANEKMGTLLKENIKKHYPNSMKSVDVISEGVYNERKIMTFNVPNPEILQYDSPGHLINFTGIATLGTNAEEVKKYMHRTPVKDEYEKIEIQCDTLDNIVEKRHPNKTVDAIKLDIEGGELCALQGARKILERDKPLLLFECDSQHTIKFDYQPEELFSFVESFGYKVTQFTEHDFMAEAV